MQKNSELGRMTEAVERMARNYNQKLSLSHDNVYHASFKRIMAYSLNQVCFQGNANGNSEGGQRPAPAKIIKMQKIYQSYANEMLKELSMIFTQKSKTSKKGKVVMPKVSVAQKPEAEIRELLDNIFAKRACRLPKIHVKKPESRLLAHDANMERSLVINKSLAAFESKMTHLENKMRAVAAPVEEVGRENDKDEEKTYAFTSKAYAIALHYNFKNPL